MANGKKWSKLAKKRKKMSSSASASDLADSSVEGAEGSEGAFTMAHEDEFWKFLKENREAISEAIMRNTTLEIEKKVTDQDEEIKVLKEDNTDLRKRLAVCEGIIAKNERAVRNTTEKVTDLQTRSMRDNILIKNMSEEAWEDDSTLEAKTKTFLEQELKIPSTEMRNLQIERIHRIGNKSRRNPQSSNTQGPAYTRNVVAKLNSRGKSIVMRNLKNLRRDCPMKITEQFPPEVHAQRNKLWPVFIAAKEDGKKTKWMQGQLQVEGKTFTAPEDRNKDINLDTTDVATKIKPKHTAVIAKDRSYIQAHTIPLTSADDVTPAVKALYADMRISGASHVMYAYRVGNEYRSIHNYEDDGEWGSARYIMEAIQEHGVYNQLVCVSRWCSDRALGRARQETVKELADLAIQGLLETHEAQEMDRSVSESETETQP
jgi:hypothetical protein